MTTATKLNKHQIYGVLKNYHWMVKEIQRIDKYLSETDFNGCAQYGIEATLPKPQGIVGKALENEIIRRTNKSKRLYKYIEEVNYINERLHLITDEKEKVVLDCLLDGLSLTAVSRHLGISRQQVTDIRDNIVDKLAK
jgi:DNA-binding NarL/FixJ family response regulator